MKILHTSDWHLGVSMEDASCAEEQSRFLQWLVETINKRDIDVLVVAGDIFHYSQPSNAARQMYYRFLVACEVETDLRQIVITGGNHDSPSGLEAPRDVLEYLNCTVVGDIAREEGWGDHLVPVEGASGEVELVVAAIPYVQEAKLGISGVDKEASEIREEFCAEFGRLYTTLADIKEQEYPDAKFVATGHLTCYVSSSEKRESDFNSQIHQTGTIGFMPPSIFDERIDYVALGHIHRMFPVEKPRVWYSGTPVATSKEEASGRYVLEYDSEEGSVESLRVPTWRDIFALEGTTEEVIEQLGALDVQGDLRPYVFIHVRDENEDYENPSFQRIEQVRDELEEPRPLIVQYRETNPTKWGDVPDEPPESLDQLTPEQVFSRMWTRSHPDDSPPDEILQMFRTLLTRQDREESDA